MILTVVMPAVVFVVALVALGRIVLGQDGHDSDWICLEGVAGAVVLHVFLTILDVVGVGWSRGLLLLVLLLTVSWVVAKRRLRSHGAAQALVTARSERVAVILLGIVAVGAFAWSALTLRSVAPDFVYHWGIKAKRYAIAQGVDWEYLARSWNDFVQPDYPNLFPELYAIGALMAGQFHEEWSMTISVLLLLAIMVAGRAALHEVVDRWIRMSGLMVVVLGSTAFSMGYFQAGGIDLGLALAALLGLRLMQPSWGRKARTERAQDQGAELIGHRRALALGFVCAFAAASKIEGVVLAALMIVAYCWRQKPKLGAIGRLVVPPVLVVGPWAVELATRDLFQRSQVAELSLTRLLEILSVLPRGFGENSWHGLSWFVVLAPLLLCSRSVRGIGAVICAQLVFFIFVYWRAPVEPTFYVLSSWPRLVFQLWPATIVALFLAASHASAQSSSEARLRPEHDRGKPR